MTNIKIIKNLLYTGQRSAISTKDFELIIEKLEESQAECYKLKIENNELKQNNKDLSTIVDRLSKELKSYQCKGKHSNQYLCAFRCLGNEFCNSAEEIINKYNQVLDEVLFEITKYKALILGKPITKRENDCLYKILSSINKAKGNNV